MNMHEAPCPRTGVSCVYRYFMHNKCTLLAWNRVHSYVFLGGITL